MRVQKVAEVSIPIQGRLAEGLSERKAPAEGHCPWFRHVTVILCLVGSAQLRIRDREFPRSPLGGETRWQLVWSDEFNSDRLDPTKWQIQPGKHAGGRGELEIYTADTSNISVSGGVLHLVARRSDRGAAQFTSGRIRTLTHAAWTYGRFEARIKLPTGLGTWPAFWILGEDLPSVGWPACGEVDIMEAIGRRPAFIFGTAHGPGFASPGIGGTYHISSGQSPNSYHVFALDWGPDALRWEVDGVVYNVLRRKDLKGTWVFDKPFFLELNLAVGGQWPGNPKRTTSFPQAMLVDYVRVYREVGS